MAKTKIEKIASIEEEIKQLENKKKRLIQEQKEQERKSKNCWKKRRWSSCSIFLPIARISIPLKKCGRR